MDIEDEHAKYVERLKALEDDGREPEIRQIIEGTDYKLKKRAKIDKKNQWALRLARLKASFADRSTKLVDHAVLRYVETKDLRVGHGSKEWEALAHRLLRAEIEALQRAIEQIEGDWTGTVKDPLVAAPFQPLAQTSSADILTLFEAYIASRQRLNKHADGGKRWKPVIDSLVRFLKHSNARKVTRSDLLAWRDHLLKAGKSAKTVADVDLACIRALFRWAHEEDRLSDNPAEGVRQESPKKIRTRERGYSTEEATRVLNESMGYVPDQDRTASTRESLHMIAAKRWLPVLCAFTGARVTEIAVTPDVHRADTRVGG